MALFFHGSPTSSSPTSLGAPRPAHYLLPTAHVLLYMLPLAETQMKALSNLSKLDKASKDLSLSLMLALARTVEQLVNDSLGGGEQELLPAPISRDCTWSLRCLKALTTLETLKHLKVHSEPSRF